MKALPFKNNKLIAIGYLVVLLAVTVAYKVVGLSSAFGHPILDLLNDPGQRFFFKSLTKFYTFLVIPVPIILSILELKRSPKHKLSFE
ncbi:MAG: hypothetical protein AB4063_26915 [Crocosphaera sp.]